MACLHNACPLPQVDYLDPVCLSTALKRSKSRKEPQPKISVKSKIPQVVKRQATLSSANFQDFENLESLNRNRQQASPTDNYRITGVNFCSDQVSYFKSGHFYNQEHSKGTFAMGTTNGKTHSCCRWFACVQR